MHGALIARFQCHYLTPMRPGNAFTSFVVASFTSHPQQLSQLPILDASNRGLERRVITLAKKVQNSNQTPDLSWDIYIHHVHIYKYAQIQVKDSPVHQLSQLFCGEEPVQLHWRVGLQVQPAYLHALLSKCFVQCRPRLLSISVLWSQLDSLRKGHIVFRTR